MPYPEEVSTDVFDISIGPLPVSYNVNQWVTMLTSELQY